MDRGGQLAYAFGGRSLGFLWVGMLCPQIEVEGNHSWVGRRYFGNESCQVGSGNGRAASREALVGVPVVRIIHEQNRSLDGIPGVQMKKTLNRVVAFVAENQQIIILLEVRLKEQGRNDDENNFQPPIPVVHIPG